MVNWTADKDQIILKGIFKFHDIKSSAPLLKYLSEEIGGDCTPKAVSHRLTNIRKGGTTRANSALVSSPACTAASTTPKATPRAKATSRRKEAVLEEFGSDGLTGLADDEVLSPTAARGKRTLSGKTKPKPKYDETSDKDNGEEDLENDYVPLAKRVKAEPLGEDFNFAHELVEDEI